MPFSAVAWAADAELTSLKLGQMVENIAVHDHRADGTQGTPIPRVYVEDVVITPVANATTFVTVNYPAGTFDPNGPLPIPLVNATSTVSGPTVRAWVVDNPTHTSCQVGVHRTNTTNTGVEVVVVQAAT